MEVCVERAGQQLAAEATFVSPGHRPLRAEQHPAAVAAAFGHPQRPRPGAMHVFVHEQRDADPPGHLFDLGNHLRATVVEHAFVEEHQQHETGVVAPAAFKAIP